MKFIMSTLKEDETGEVLDRKYSCDYCGTTDEYVYQMLPDFISKIRAMAEHYSKCGGEYFEVMIHTDVDMSCFEEHFE